MMPMNEQLTRCAYWIGRARALAALSDDKEIAEMLDKAADSLCEGVGALDKSKVQYQYVPVYSTTTVQGDHDKWTKEGKWE